MAIMCHWSVWTIGFNETCEVNSNLLFEETLCMSLSMSVF